MAAGVSPGDPPELSQAAEDIAKAGLEAGRSAWGVATSFRTLVAADIALSRSAFGLTLAYTGAAIALGASAWLLLMGVLVLSLQATGLALVWALLLPALLSATGAGICGYIASRVFTDTRLSATRRQLANLGLANDPAKIESDPEHVT